VIATGTPPGVAGLGTQTQKVVPVKA